MSARPLAYAFGACRIDERMHVLARDGTPVPVEPLVFDLLVYLIRNRGRLVTKAELLQTLWENRAVREDALAACVRRARRAIGDIDPTHRIIQTVHRRGFRFVPPG
jgi:DNA-binding winged helix-turn-helix (wHTH) protein